MKIGYIGIGIMGRPMAHNLLRAGHELYIYNRTAEKCAPLEQIGAKVEDSPAAVTHQSEVVFTNVPDTDDVEKVIFGQKGIYEEAREGLVVIDNSTISPAATREFAKRLKREKAAEYLDAPVHRVAAEDVFVAYQPAVEDATLPQVADLVRTMRQLAIY